jgi:hypothetical protein
MSHTLVKAGLFPESAAAARDVSNLGNWFSRKSER